MGTPIFDFVTAYRDRNALRLHMPGHKGVGALGVEALDITEISGADVLYHADGIIGQSEANAATLFGTARTVYSTEGSSLAIRAMLYLAVLCAKTEKKQPVIAAGRNAHKTFLTAAALMDIDPVWIYPEQREDILSCEITAADLERFFAQWENGERKDRWDAGQKTPDAVCEKPTAVYITSPDYLGNVADVRALAEVCHRHGALLLVDNAHGAYLRFLPNRDGNAGQNGNVGHPMMFGADICCDSAHKTLPVLTGGAYLHISKGAPEWLAERADQAMALFASTSPSYLILQSLDLANRYLTEGYRERLAGFVKQVERLKQRLTEAGYVLVGNEPLKVTVRAKSYGYTGDELAALLEAENMVCEFSDPDYVVLMLTPELSEQDLEKIGQILTGLEQKEEIFTRMPGLPVPEKRFSPREALFLSGKREQIDRCLGKVLVSPSVSCPPAIPVVVCGEVIDEAAVKVFAYYGIETCVVC